MSDAWTCCCNRRMCSHPCSTRHPYMSWHMGYVLKPMSRPTGGYPNLSEQEGRTLGTFFYSFCRESISFLTLPVQYLNHKRSRDLHSPPHPHPFTLQDSKSSQSFHFTLFYLTLPYLTFTLHYITLVDTTTHIYYIFSLHSTYICTIHNYYLPKLACIHTVSICMYCSYFVHT